MLHAAIDSDVQLVGFGDFGGSAAVQQLQEAMLALSQTGIPTANPGPITGEVTPQLIRSLGKGVIDNLPGLSGETKFLLNGAIGLALFDSTALGAAQNLVAQYASELRLAVLGLVAKRTGNVPLPPSTVTTAASTTPKDRFPAFRVVTSLQKMSPQARVVSPTLPPGSLQAKTVAGTYRVAVPKSATAGLGGTPLGESLVELAPRTAPSAGAILVTEPDLDKALKPPFYKRPLYWAVIGGGLAVAGGAYWMIRR